MKNTLYNSQIVEEYYQFCLNLKNKLGLDWDCFQIALLDLLECKRLKELYYKGDLKYWIVKVFKNEWFSKTSRYYYTYKRYKTYELPDC